MIRNRLSDLMGMKQIKISKLSNDTGIARSTLTPLYYNQSTMIKLDTINTLINYFQVDISSFFESTTFDFDFRVKEYGKNGNGLILSINEKRESNIDLDLLLEVEITEGSKKEVIEMIISYIDDYSEIDIFYSYKEPTPNKVIEVHPESTLNFEFSFPNEENRNIFKSYFNRMSLGMYGVLQSNIIDFLKNEYIHYFEKDTSHEKLKRPSISKSEIFERNNHIGLNEKPVWNYFGTSEKNKEE